MLALAASVAAPSHADRKLYGEEMSWEDAAQYLAADKNHAVGRATWVSGLGILYVYQTNAGDVDDATGKPAVPHYVCLRDFNPRVPRGIWHNYNVSYDWSPSSDERRAKDWKKYGDG